MDEIGRLVLHTRLSTYQITAPREPFEFEPTDGSKEARESREFWDLHALAVG